jgi:hypothetical protein
MSVVMPSFVRLVERAWTGEADMTQTDQWMSMTTRLASDLGEAVPLPLDNSGNPRLAFAVSPNRLSFVHRSLTGDREALETVTLIIHSDAKGSSLTRAARPFRKDDFDDNGRGQEVALLITPYQLRFDAIDIKQEATDDGSTPNSLPGAVTLAIQGNGYHPNVPFVFPIVARYPVHAVTQTSN